MEGQYSKVLASVMLFHSLIVLSSDTEHRDCPSSENLMRKITPYKRTYEPACHARARKRRETDLMAPKLLEDLSLARFCQIEHVPKENSVEHCPRSRHQSTPGEAIELCRVPISGDRCEVGWEDDAKERNRLQDAMLLTAPEAHHLLEIPGPYFDKAVGISNNDLLWCLRGANLHPNKQVIVQV